MAKKGLYAETYKDDDTHYFTTAEYAWGEIPGGDHQPLYCTPANHKSGQVGAK